MKSQLLDLKKMLVIFRGFGEYLYVFAFSYSPDTNTNAFVFYPAVRTKRPRHTTSSEYESENNNLHSGERVIPVPPLMSGYI